MSASRRESTPIVLIGALVAIAVGGAVLWLLLESDPIESAPQDPVSAQSNERSGSPQLIPAPMDTGNGMSNRKVAEAPKLSGGFEFRSSGPSDRAARTPRTLLDLRQAARWVGVDLAIPTDLPVERMTRLRSIHAGFIMKRKLLEKTRGPLVLDLVDKLEAQGQYREWKSVGSVKDPAERARIRREIKAARAQAGQNFALSSGPKHTRLIVVPHGHSILLDELTRKFRENAMYFVTLAQNALVR